VLAGVLFAAGRLLRSDESRMVELDPAMVASTVAELEAARGAPLSPEERLQVERALVDEEVLVREALARGLDEGDPRIRDILVQKMLHVLSADVIQPSEAELRAQYEAGRDRYATPGALTAEELVVPLEGALPSSLRLQLDDGTAAAELRSDLPITSRVLRDATGEDLRMVFGVETAARVESAEVGRWVGPHPSPRGQHWFRVIERQDSRVLPFEEVREQVRLDWIAAQEAARLEERVREIRERYSVVRSEEAEAP
jgi:hypothetical protein